jgi:nucleotide-binding universal stress UspA family protein
VRSSAWPVLVARDTGTDITSWEGGGRLRLTVATDGSAASQSALTWAGQFARGGSCDLSLVRFYFPSEESVRYGLDDPWDVPHRDAELLSLIRRDLRRDARSLLGEVPERIRFRAIAHEASDALSEESAMLGADAVVIGVPRHRWKGWTAIAPGAVLRSSRLPIVCVPEAPTALRHPTTPVRSILVAIDLSDVSRDVVASAYGLLHAQGGHIELCTVHEVGAADGFAQVPLAPPLGTEERTALESRLRALVPDDADRLGITTHLSVIEGATAAQAILAAAERMDVNLIAVGTHGRTGFTRAVLGSVAEEVARNSTRPVLLVRGRADRARP